MAHTCPDCGVICHCGGDIDDLVFGESIICYHCDDDDDDYYVNDECNECSGLNGNHFADCSKNTNPFHQLQSKGHD